MSSAQEALVRYTYQDYASWPDDKRCELIEGIPQSMTAPLQVHQEISMELAAQFRAFLRGKPCKVFAAPFDVRLNVSERDNIVVQPDLVVVCDKAKLNGKHCVGVPDLVIEILSASTANLDRFKKFNLYLKYGVNEYWIVDPDARGVEVFILEDGRYIRYGYEETATVPVQTLPGLEIKLTEVFEPVAE